MISVTRQAATELRVLIKHSHGQPGQAMRLASNGKVGISMGLDLAHAGDVVLEDRGVPVLIIAGGLARPLDGLVFDWLVSEVDGRRTAGFTFRPAADDGGTPGAAV
jgi:Fe-S cluster assembly iron-binding protein IscA